MRYSLTMNEIKNKLSFFNIQKNPVLLLFLLTLIIRIFFIYESELSSILRYPLIDSLEYHETALSIINKDLPSGPFWQPPLYTFMLSFIYRIAGPSVLIIKIIQLLLSLFSVLVIYHITLLISHKRGSAVIAGVASAFFAPFIFYSVLLLSVTLEIFFLSLIVLIIIYASKFAAQDNQKHLKKLFFLLFAGILTGLLIITRPTFMVLVPVIVIFIFLQELKKPGNAIIRVMVYSVTLLLPIVPVTIYNYVESKSFVPVSVNGGVNLYIGNNNQSEKTINARPGWDWEQLIMNDPKKSGVKNGVELDKYFYGKVRSYINENPVNFFMGQIQKFWLLLSSREIPRTFDIYSFRSFSRVLNILIWKIGDIGFPGVLIFPVSLLGIFAALKSCDKKLTIFLLMLIVLYSFSIVLFFVASRYKTAIMPLVFPFFGIGSMHLVSYFKEQKKRNWMLFAMLLAAIVIVSFPRRSPTDKVNYRAEIFSAVTDIFTRQGNEDSIGVYLKAAVKEEPSSAEHRTALADWYFNNGNALKAEMMYREVLMQDSTFVPAMNGMGSVALAKDDYDAAIHFFRYTAEKAYGVASIHLSLGIAYFNKNYTDSALTEFEIAKKLKPKWDVVDKYIGMTYGAQGNKKSAINYLKSYCEKVPGDREAKDYLSSFISQ